MATISKELVKAQNFYTKNNFLKGIIDASNGASYAFKVVNGVCMKLAIASFSSLIRKVGKDKDIFIPTNKVTNIQPIGNGDVVTFKNANGKLDCGFVSIDKRIQFIEFNYQSKKYEKSEKDYSSSNKSLDDLIVEMNNWVNS